MCRVVLGGSSASNFIFSNNADKIYCVDFFYMNLVWFDCTKPPMVTRCVGCLCTSSGCFSLVLTHSQLKSATDTQLLSRNAQAM